MAGLLTGVSTSYKTSAQGAESFLTEVREPVKPAPRLVAKTGTAKTPDDALEILRSQPDYETLISTLEFLRNGASNFSIKSPSPLAAQLVHILVSETVPSYWNVLLASKISHKQGRKKDSSSDLEFLLFCLRSVTGLNAILLSLKQLIQQSKESKKKLSVGSTNVQEVLKILLGAISALLEGDGTVEAISKDIWKTSDGPAKQNAVWNEFLGIASGKILGISAEAEDIMNELAVTSDKYWISDGALYSLWVARNISHWSQNLVTDDETGWKSCVEFLSKSFRLGYTESIIMELLTSLVLKPQNYAKHFEKLLSGLPSFEQKNFIITSLKLISREYLSSVVTSEDDSRWWRSDEGLVSAATGLVSLILGEEESRLSQLIAWLTNSSGAGIGDGIGIRRAAIAALAVDKTNIERILERSLQQFGDQLYIKHTPTMQQEVHTQVLLLSVGYLHRKSPLRLATIMRSGTYLSLVSNRISASSPRARFLGMVVGETLSELVDKGDKKMDFKMEETKTPEAKWYKSLVTVSDTVGSLDPLKPGAVSINRQNKIQTAKPKQATKPKIYPGSSKIVAIEEIEDSESEQESDNDGLVPYAKPDSDEADSDEDATLITRNKPIAPVYVRDLITYLRDIESYDRQKLALHTAAPLIRRKASFGTEVSSHSEELATLLVGLQDKYDIEGFQEMRLQGMIAVLVAQPLKMGQWFSKTFFDGDYSLSQRAAILTTISLGARELGGFAKVEDELSTQKSSSSLASKALPEKMHKLYAPEGSAVDKLSSQLSNTIIVPMAAELADKVTGPSILKVRTFSSRMEVEKKRQKPIANSLAKVVADGFFFPLTGRFFIHLRAYGSSRSNVVFQPYLLALFIKTLSLLLHASGPSTLSLPQMTSEFWDLLLSLRTQAIGDITIIEALLFAFLMILEINEDKRRLVEAHGRQMLETQEWAEGVFGRLDSGGSEEDQKVRMLAAGCLVRIREVVEKYQALLMGDLASFRN